jgi:hypothetical protein
MLPDEVTELLDGTGLEDLGTGGPAEEPVVE